MSSAELIAAVKGGDVESVRALVASDPSLAEATDEQGMPAVRVALLLAGFFVTPGAGTGPKSETTIAFTTARGSANHPLAPRLLDQSWLRRWRRSGAKFPAHLAIGERPNFEKLIETHPQFSTALVME